jgi:hypothetical protein
MRLWITSGTLALAVSWAFIAGHAEQPAKGTPADIAANAKKLKEKKAETAKTTDKAPEKAVANKETSGGKFLRVIRTDKGVVTGMETSIARYVPSDATKKGPIVDLISAVHVGEKAYYKALDKSFENYDVVLYELVAPEGTRVPKGGGERRGVVSGIQGGMKDILALEFQLEQVDYTKKNLVHADMSPDQFASAMKDRGESMTSMIFKMMGASMAMQSEMQAKGQGGAEMEMLFALFDPTNRALKLKRAMAVQFENMDNLSLMFGGKDGSTIIEGRNVAALDVLKKQIADGKQKIGIFYGGGHMPDMEKRLLKDFGMKFENEEWLEAWSMPEPAKKE